MWWFDHPDSGTGDWWWGFDRSIERALGRADRSGERSPNRVDCSKRRAIVCPFNGGRLGTERHGGPRDGLCSGR